MRFTRLYTDQEWSAQMIRLTIAVGLVFIQKTDATCNEVQMDSCRKAARDNELDSLPGGGKCTARQYVQFTHSCTVTNYMPSIDHCCCAYDQKVLCCRYHQDWDHFRCSQADDTIDTLSKSSLPLEILLPAIFGPLAALVCCIVCCVKCWCYSYEEDAEVFCCCCKKCCEDRECGEEKRPPHDRRPRDEVNVPLTFGRQASTMGTQTSQDGSETKLLQCPSENGRIEPTAPPIAMEPEDSAFVSYNPNQNLPRDSFRHSQSVPAHAHRLQDNNDCYACANNGNSSNGAPQRPVCSSCSSCPPPSYDESQQHPVLPPHQLHLLNAHSSAHAREHFHSDRAHSLDEAPTCSVHRSDEI